MEGGSSCPGFGRLSLRWKCIVPYSSCDPYFHYNHIGHVFVMEITKSTLFVIILTRILGDMGKGKKWGEIWGLLVQNKSCCLMSFSHPYEHLRHFYWLLCDLCQPTGCILFKEQCLIFECTCFFEVILLNFFLTCVNTIECVVLKKMPPFVPKKALL